MNEYYKLLDEIVDECFDIKMVKNWTLKEFARRAKLAYTTVWHLQERHTRYPRFKTVWLLCKACGLELYFRTRMKKAV